MVSLECIFTPPPACTQPSTEHNINIMTLRSRMLFCGALLALLVALGLVWAQSADAPARQSSVDSMPVDVDRGAAGLTRWLHALQTRASLLMITAHPDDEDGGMLARETRGGGTR